MALFQISEPDESPLPHARKRAVGIDLGTTHSLVATVRNGPAVVLPDNDGRPLVPSRQLVDERLDREAGTDPDRRLTLAFRLACGRGASEEELAACRRFLQKQRLAYAKEKDGEERTWAEL